MSYKVRVLAIDPGTEQSAIVALRADGSVFSGEILPNIYVCGQVLQEDWGEDTMLAIEGVQSYGMAVGQTTLDTCVWIGRFIECWYPRKANILYRKKESPPFPSITMHLCKSQKAKDTNIRQALIDRYGGTKDKAIGTQKSPGPLYGFKSHMWSALAVGVTCLDTIGRAGHEA